MIGIQEDREIEFFSKSPYQGCDLTNAQKFALTLGRPDDDRNL